jgi:hypothetical protein
VAHCGNDMRGSQSTPQLGTPSYRLQTPFALDSDAGGGFGSRGGTAASDVRGARSGGGGGGAALPRPVTHAGIRFDSRGCVLVHPRNNVLHVYLCITTVCVLFCTATCERARTFLAFFLFLPHGVLFGEHLATAGGGRRHPLMCFVDVLILPPLAGSKFPRERGVVWASISPRHSTVRCVQPRHAQCT